MMGMDANGVGVSQANTSTHTLITLSHSHKHTQQHFCLQSHVGRRDAHSSRLRSASGYNLVVLQRAM
jgi:hypothetical protein